jgi:large subunit ribosomal protein L33
VEPSRHLRGATSPVALNWPTSKKVLNRFYHERSQPIPPNHRTATNPPWQKVRRCNNSQFHRSIPTCTTPLAAASDAQKFYPIAADPSTTAKSRTITVRVISMAMTGYFKTFRRARTARPMSFLKYDPIGKPPPPRWNVPLLGVAIEGWVRIILRQ